MHPADTAQSNRDKRSEYHSLGSAIQHLHAAIADLTGADEKSKATAALNTLTSIQAEAHKPYVGPERRPT